MSRSRKVGLFFIVISILISITYHILLNYVERQLETLSHENTYNECKKVWATRGLIDENETDLLNAQNSIASVRKAFAHGAIGAEIDHFYDIELKKFFVSHDRPYKLKDGELLTLEKFFNAVGNGSEYFWLDFKKLRHLTEDEMQEVVVRLNDITQHPGLKQRIYVEGANPHNLSIIKRAGFNTIFDTHPETESFLLTTLMLNLYKIVYYFGDYTVMAMKYGDLGNPVYGPKAIAALGNIPVFIYHVPDDPALIQELSKSPVVRVFMLNDHTINRYKTNTCNGTK
jgi:hypothetical protein